MRSRLCQRTGRAAGRAAGYLSVDDPEAIEPATWLAEATPADLLRWTAVALWHLMRRATSRKYGRLG
jgi:hypothetical protein